MNNTPNSNRPHIVFYGKTNAGKSTLMNKVLGQDFALVSDKPGTTTDYIQKAMELIPFGPVLFIDTAGLFDSTELGQLRVNRTFEVLKRTDLGIYVADGSGEEINKYISWRKNFKKYNIPHLLVINKVDMLQRAEIDELKKSYKDAFFTSGKTGEGIKELKEGIIKQLETNEGETSLIGDLVPYNGKVVMVVPVDSEAPKGRIILPQVQCIRDCLDHGIKTYVLRDTELEEGLRDLKDIDLVVTDSQAFKEVSAMVPQGIKLTSFSILFARQKGRLEDFIVGANAVRSLKPGSKVLISESCTHNVSHEDIGRVKIPKLLNKYVGGNLNFDFKVGHDFAENVEDYDLVIHCGACMINRKTVINRIDYCNGKKVPITNYGVILAFLTGILDRAVEIY